jgi:hypothetical protein
MNFTEIQLFNMDHPEDVLHELTPEQRIYRGWPNMTPEQIAELLWKRYHRVDILPGIRFYDYGDGKIYTRNEFNIDSIRVSGQYRLARSIYNILPNITDPIDQDYLRRLYNAIRNENEKTLSLNYIISDSD